jgi:hypothetical protein
MSPRWSDQPLQRYESKSIKKNGVSYMMDQWGNCVPSVTTILNHLRTPFDNLRLFNWRKRVGDWKANQVMQIGKKGHQYTEHYLCGEVLPCPPIIKEHWQQLKPILDQFHNIKLVEGNLFHLYGRYGGRVDLIANYQNLPMSVVEFKFADTIKPIYEETKLQLASYAGAVNRHYGTRINHGLVITVTPDQAQIDVISPAEIMEYWHKWEEKLSIFWNQQNVA